VAAGWGDGLRQSSWGESNKKIASAMKVTFTIAALGRPEDGKTKERERERDGRNDG